MCLPSWRIIATVIMAKLQQTENIDNQSSHRLVSLENRNWSGDQPVDNDLLEY